MLGDSRLASLPRLGPALAAAAIAALLVAPSASAAQEQQVGNGTSVTPSPERVIVEWAGGASPSERRTARDAAEVAYAGDLGSRRFQLVETEPGQAPREAVRELKVRLHRARDKLRRAYVPG